MAIEVLNRFVWTCRVMETTEYFWSLIYCMCESDACMDRLIEHCPSMAGRLASQFYACQSTLSFRLDTTKTIEGVKNMRMTGREFGVFDLLDTACRTGIRVTAFGLHNLGTRFACGKLKFHE